VKLKLDTVLFPPVSQIYNVEQQDEQSWGNMGYYSSTCLEGIMKTMRYLRHRLSVFENRVLRRIFGPKRDEVTGG
jgi:hypothetical protein